MASVNIHANVEEEDIWNYTSSVSRTDLKTSGKKRQSKSFNNIAVGQKEKKKESSCTDEESSTVIYIDSDEEFSFPSPRPAINNDKSALQWASMLAKGNGVDNDKLKGGKQKNKKKSVPSRLPLKTKTNHPAKNSDSKRLKLNNACCKNEYIQTKPSKNIMSYLSPTKTITKKMKLSDSDSEEDLFNSMDEIDELHPQSNLNDEKINGKLSCLNTPTASYTGQLNNSVQNELLLDDSTILNDLDEQGPSVISNFDETKPKVVDVIVLGDGSDASFVTNKTYLIDTISISDTDMDKIDSDTEISGGFIQDPCDSNSSPQVSQSLSNREDGFTASGTCDRKSISSIDCASNVLSIPLSTAARKQISIDSFFSMKASISTSKPKVDAFVTKSDVLGSNKTINYPLRKASSHTSGEVSKPTSSSGNSGNNQYRGRQRQCPFYKRMPGTSFTVDAFRYGDIPNCTAYFLTHFHYDHYGGLTKKFSFPIYCSVITGNLVEKRLGVDKRWIHRLPLWKPVLVEGVTLTLMEANHCPGAVIVLFETKDGKKILHTGDFRASVEMEDYLPLKNIVVDELYLDTTYCNPSYAFPSQKTVIDFAVSLVEKQMKVNPKTLFVCGAYTIGKERIFTAIAKALDSKICVMSDKKKVLDCLEDQDLKKRVTLNWSEGQVHVLPMAKLKQEPLFEHHSRHSHYTAVVAFEPTGWTHSNKAVSLESLQPKWSENAVTLYGVPYSEHSSYLELKRFVQFIRPRKILPTVNNGNAGARKKMEDIFADWLSK